ncbi:MULTISPECIES: phage holin family protein [unclassified Actinotalea]|uniref:phage holin family protein n=1 Tax=unclassified Actinotalea TaxID=2638618 RepID=UPI002106235A|nr:MULTISPECIES: phage holin family protein [unclassified Actinotalea]
MSGNVDPTVAAGRPAADPGQGSAGQASLGELFSNVTRDLSTLMRQEVALAKAELADSGKKAGKGAGMLSGAAVAGHFVLIFLSVALWWGLGDLMDNWTISAIIVAVLWGVVAAVLALKGRTELQKVKGVPQTQETVAMIPNALKGHEEENR